MELKNSTDRRIMAGFPAIASLKFSLKFSGFQPRLTQLYGVIFP
jgi:hypothetical protein